MRTHLANAAYQVLRYGFSPIGLVLMVSIIPRCVSCLLSLTRSRRNRNREGSHWCRFIRLEYFWHPASRLQCSALFVAAAGGVLCAPCYRALAAQVGTGRGHQARCPAFNAYWRDGRSSLSRNFWHYRRLPELAARLEVDLVHLTYPVPVNAAAFSCPTVVTLHDMYPYEIPMNFGFPKFIFNRLILKQCLRNVDAIACVSDVTRRRLEQYSSAAVWQKGVRIYNCVEAQPACASQSPIPNWQGEPFLLCVAQHRHNKNLPLLIRAFDRLLRSGQVGSNMRLVILGITAQDTRNIYRLVSTLSLGDSICFLEGLSEAELQWCYTRCEAVVAPSLTEGFGLPVAEGLLAGCRLFVRTYRRIGK